MRLFVAINLPPGVRQAVWDSAASLREGGFPIRWVAADAIHLTLKFLGEVDQGREDDIAAAMERVGARAARFSLPLSGFGAFPNGIRPKVVWVGCEPVPPLEILQHQIELETEQLGFPVEVRTFRPHLTLGRVRREARTADLVGFDAALDEVRFNGDIAVETIDLMRSELRPTGAVYTVRRSLILSG